MKPRDVRKLRVVAEQAREARGEALQRFLTGGGNREEVVPDLIPTAADQAEALGAVRTLARAAERHPKGSSGRGRKMDQLVFAVARLVAIERVLELDPLERAGLTPRRLAVIADTVRPEDLRARLASLHGESRTVAP